MVSTTEAIFGGNNIQTKKPDPNIAPALEKIRAKKAEGPKGLEPLVKPEYKAPSKSTLEPVNQPTLQDFIGEAQKLSTQKTDAQAQILGQDTSKVAEEFARQLYGTNLGATSGVGKELTNRAVQDQAKRLEPYAMQQAAELGQQELGYKREDYLTDKAQTQSNRDNMFNQILAGTVDKSQMSEQDWAAMGITDPAAVKTLSEVDLSNAMVGQGLDPNNPEHQAQYRQELKDSTSKTLKRNILASYAASNDGRIPSVEEQEMMMIVFGGDTGLLTPEEQNAIISKYNADQWQRTMDKAEIMNPPDDSGGFLGISVLCTELHRQGLISDRVYSSDEKMGEYFKKHDRSLVVGYHLWARPLTKFMKRSKILTLILKPFIIAWANEMHYEVTGELKSTITGRLLQKTLMPLCRILGVLHFKSAKLIRRVA